VAVTWLAEMIAFDFLRGWPTLCDFCVKFQDILYTLFRDILYRFGAGGCWVGAAIQRSTIVESFLGHALLRHRFVSTILFRIRTYAKRARNPFTMNTSKTKHLKPFRMNTYEKTGEGSTCLIAHQKSHSTISVHCRRTATHALSAPFLRYVVTSPPRLNRVPYSLLTVHHPLFTTHSPTRLTKLPASFNVKRLSDTEKEQ
jgi:hypothetical protein